MLEASIQGDTFLSSYRLLGRRPDFSGAVHAINQACTFLTGGTTPTVSIIIPVYGQLAYTLNCIHSLIADLKNGEVEILIGDDASTDETSKWLPKVEGIRYVPQEQNVGFISNCNLIAGSAKGKYVVLLNNDTRVVEGWLEAIVTTLERDDQVGLVGAKLFYPDGSLQEAGGIVWQDGSAWNYGRADDPNRPRYSHARQVDYVSGCAIAMRRTDWDEMNGFDPLYRPAYYEDTDLAFRVRQSGREVWMQPLAKVIHYEGKSSGTDLESGVKAYQRVNSKKFFERWRLTLESYRRNGESPWLERNRLRTRFVLIVDTVTPTPDQDAGSLATVNLIRAYQALGFHVIFVPEDNFLYVPGATDYLQSLGVECLYAPYETSMSDLLSRYAPYLDIIQLIRPVTASRTLNLVKSFAPNALCLYLNADIHFLRLERQAIVEGRDELLHAAISMKKIELEIIDSVDETFVHSFAEQDLLIKLCPAARISVMPLAYPDQGEQRPEDRRDIMFLGGYNHPPNVDAATWLIQDIWPLLLERYPEARLLIVGANAPAELLAFATDRILVTGKVDELEPWFSLARVFVAPLRYGAGAKGKIIAAQANGVPVVATSIAVEGMGLRPGENVLVSDDASEIARSISEVYEADDDKWLQLSSAGRESAMANNSLDTIVKTLECTLRSKSRGLIS